MKNIIALYSALFVMMAASSQDLWERTTYPSSKGQKPTTLSKHNVPTANLFTLNITQLKSMLSKAPARSKTALKSKSTIQLPIPNAKGELELFTIYEASIMHPDLAAKYPNIKSYVGQGITDPAAIIRFSVTPNGLQGICRGTKNTFYINSLAPESNIYSSYTRDELPKSASQFICGFKEETSGYAQKARQSTNTISNNTLRTYRLAASATAEYTLYYGSKEAALIRIVNTMNYVNGIFERDFGITMELIPNTDVLIFEDPDTDPYTNGPLDDNTFNEDLQQTLTEIIGSDNYDIGHLFGYISDKGNYGAGGGRGSVCNEYKGSGYSILDTPDDIEGELIIAHEMGHQFGAGHTFGHEGDGDNRIEPGTGSTIMSYGGSGSSNGWDVVDIKDPYFHGFSIEEILINTTNDCEIKTTTGNEVPSILPQPATYFTPTGTPFILDFPAKDSDGDLLTYCWEQMDSDDSTTIIPDRNSDSGPAFRSYPPTENSARYFPRLETVLKGKTEWDWEAIPAVPRTMNFRLTVRDNNPKVAAIVIQDITVYFKDSEEGGFRVLEPASPNWAISTEQIVTWNVAGTTENGIDTPFVDIFLSTDGGNTFPTTLAENTPNDGEEYITVPNLLGTNNRVMVKAVDNIFYDISDYDFTISRDDIESPCESTFIGNMIYTPGISNLTSLVNTQISSNGENAAAEVAFTYYENQFIIAGNPTYLEGVFSEYAVDNQYGLIRNDDGSLALVSESDSDFDIDCQFNFTIVFICTTKEQYSYATSLPEIASELHLHPEMALLSYFGRTESIRPSILIRSAGPTRKMSARSYKYLSDNNFWTLEPTEAQYHYLGIKKHLGWTLPNYWFPKEEYEENGGWNSWLRNCSATYFLNQSTFYGVKSNDMEINLQELGYFAIPRNPGDRD